jgi:uncharacterized protein YggE
MNTRLIAGLAVTFGLAVTVAAFAQPRFGANLAQGATQASDTSAPKTVTVVGTGKVMVAPDVAFISGGVQTRAKTAREAQTQNSAAMTAVLDRIKTLGIDAKDVQTSGVSLYPDNQPMRDPNVQPDNQSTAYVASNVVTVRVQNIASAGGVLDALVDAGANTGVSIRFGLKDSSAAELQALEAATKEAQGRAEAIARGIGVKLVGIESAVEDGGSAGSPIPLNAKADGMGVGSLPIQPGELAVSARVRVTYSY